MCFERRGEARSFNSRDLHFGLGWDKIQDRQDRRCQASDLLAHNQKLLLELKTSTIKTETTIKFAALAATLLLTAWESGAERASIRGKNSVSFLNFVLVWFLRISARLTRPRSSNLHRYPRKSAFSSQALRAGVADETRGETPSPPLEAEAYATTQDDGEDGEFLAGEFLAGV